MSRDTSPMKGLPGTVPLPPSPYVRAKTPDQEHKNTPTVRSYENIEFLHSHDARTIRILCEFQEPARRLTKSGISGTILFFGSARAMSPADHEATVSDLKMKHDMASCEEDRLNVEARLASLQKIKWMCDYVDKAAVLSKMLTEWAMNSKELKESFSAGSDYLSGLPTKANEGTQTLVVTTGGGPGMMEAANRGARSIPGAKTMGMGITLPFERGLNPFVSEDMAFEFHYFFTRKFWMMYSVKALVLCPGGFGTLDELFELMTLVQTGKIPKLPIVLFGTPYWKTVINWTALAEFGTVSQAEIDKLFFTDDVDAAFKHVTQEIIREAKVATPMQRL